MKAHAKKHTNQSIQCPKCPITFKTVAEYNQHNKGCHGEGYVMPCGIKKTMAQRGIKTQKAVCGL